LKPLFFGLCHPETLRGSLFFLVRLVRSWSLSLAFDATSWSKVLIVLVLTFVLVLVAISVGTDGQW
jgi:hypothetical protein